MAAQAIRKCSIDPEEHPHDSQTTQVSQRPTTAEKQDPHDPIPGRFIPTTKGRTKRMVGRSPSMVEILRLIDMVADKKCSVLIMGETGTGKELVARAIHCQGPRSKHPFVALNCGAIPEHLLEDELFGHVKGAYTSAHNNRIGRIEQAHTGTLFLDEIGTMNHDLQVRLLRVLQEREFQRLGSNTDVRVDVRIVAATNMDLLEQVKQNRFRADLYYRLNVFPISLSPLRSRKEDIPVLVTHFLNRTCSQYDIAAKTLDPVALELLLEYEWPGNIRELENAIESAVILSNDSPSLRLGHFPVVMRSLQENLACGEDLELPEEGIDYQNVVCNIERNLLLEGLRRFGGNRSKAAGYLNLKRTTLLEKMKRLDINEERMRRVARA